MTNLVPESEQQYGSILTVLGENAEQNGKLLNKQIVFTHIAFGDANDTYVQPDRKAQGLVNELHRIPVNSVDVLQATPDSVPILKVEAILPDDVNDVVIREFAAVATFNGQSYFHAIGNCARVYVPRPINNGNVSNPVTLEMTFVITSAEPIVEIDPNVVTASREWTDKNFVAKKGAAKGLTVRPMPGNEKETEWFRPGIYDVTSYGPVGKGEQHHDAAFSETRTQMLSDGGGKMLLPANAYKVTQSIMPDSAQNSGRINIEGEHRSQAIIETEEPIDLIGLRERINVEKVTLRCAAKNNDGTRMNVGRALTTNDHKQTAISSLRDMTIDGFRFGIWKRYSLWDEYRNLELKRNTCGIRLSRHAYQSDNSDPSSSAIWNNWNDGYFHNVGTMDNVYCEGGEVGIWASTMCHTYMGVTCQGQRANGLNNDVLPTGMLGTGMYLDNGKNTSSQSFNNAIISYYVESSDVGLHLKNRSYTSVDGFFMQGGPGNQKAHRQMIADNSHVMVRGLQGQDWFEAVVEAKNNSTVVIEGVGNSTQSGTKFISDATSRILARGQCDLPIHAYHVSKGHAQPNKSFTLPRRLKEVSVTKLTAVCVFDGRAPIFHSAEIIYWNGNIPPKVTWAPKLKQENGVWIVENDGTPDGLIQFEFLQNGTIIVKLVSNYAITGRIYLDEQCNSESHPTVVNIEGVEI
ncbi:TPA: phage tail protein [Vibrio cholerae]